MSNGKLYTGPGKYFAVCNNQNFDGHYIKFFEVPETVHQDASASWYFMNYVDGVACVEAVYPIEIFDFSKII